MKVEGADLVWSTGRRVYCGYGENGMPVRPDPWGIYAEHDDMTTDEKIELGTYMSLQWLAYVEKNK